MTGTQLDEVGNTEMLNWAVMFGAIGAMEGELIDYIPTWHHGLCMMRFLPQRARTKARMQVADQFGGFKFANQGFLFYKHPPSEAYGLNKLLFESRHSADLRQPHHQRLRGRVRSSTSCAASSARRRGR